MILNYEISAWSVIIFLFAMSLIMGSIGLYLGWLSRKKLSEKKTKVIDILVILVFVCYELMDIKYWFVEGHYDGTDLENAFIVFGIYYSLGMAFILYAMVYFGELVGNFLAKISKRNGEDEDDVDGEVSTQETG